MLLLVMMLHYLNLLDSVMEHLSQIPLLGSKEDIKQGTILLQTAGLGLNNGGKGGNGATGGFGGANGFGGGGGSGYTDGGVTVVSTQSGGSDKTNALVVMRLVT